jgi:hypothetical protein
MKKFHLFFCFVLSILMISCTKEIDISLPVHQPKLVVEGHIDPGMPPIVFLSKSVGYFDPFSLNTFSENFVKDATVIVSDGLNNDTLELICTNDVPEALKPMVAEFLGISPELFQKVNICGYISLNPLLFGQTGKTYFLKINYNNEEYVSSTLIPPPVKLDSLWFQLWGKEEERGFIYGIFSDPPGLGNYYRWFAKRQGKDSRFIAPIGSAFEDKFIDGRTFEFFASRGSDPNTIERENREDIGYFKTGDTVVIKFCTTDRGSFEFYRSFETEVANTGNPFAAPTLVKGNISNNALGIWGGYGVSYDTIICIPRK